MASAMPNYQDIFELIKKGATLEAQERIMELRETLVSLQEERQALKERVLELESALAIQGDLLFDNGVYWRVSGGDGEREGPFCQHCYDVNDRLVRLQHARSNGTRGNHCWACAACKNRFAKEHNTATGLAAT